MSDKSGRELKMALFSETRIETRFYEKRVVHEGVSADKATDILEGFEKKALENLAGEFRLESNSLKGSILISENPASLDQDAIVLFELNGKRHQVKVPLERGLKFDGPSALRLFHKVISEAIAASLLKSSIGDAMKFLGRHK